MIPIAQQGIKVLGTPIGHPDFVPAQLEAVRRNTRCCSIEFLPSVTSSVRGCFCSTVLLLGRAII